MISHFTNLQFKPVQLDKDKDACIRFREDSFVVSFGNANKFHEEDGLGAERYIDWLKSKISKDPNSVVHLFENDKIIGQVEVGFFSKDPSIGYVNLYYLIPSKRGAGLSSVLDEYTTNFCAKLGCHKMRLSVSPTNIPALKYYQKMGWMDLGPSLKHPEVHIMEKDLSQVKQKNLHDLPPNLPLPVDDGKTNHLVGMRIPEIVLTSTDGVQVDLKNEFQDPTVLFIYPRAGSPLEPNADLESWDSIPGARGCTPQSCGFRDLAKDFRKMGFKIYGLSIQSPVVQKEFVQRNHIPFPILSDLHYKLTDLLNLPTFVFAEVRLIKRMAFVIKSGVILKVFYPVFPPDKNAEVVLSWLQMNSPK